MRSKQGKFPLPWAARQAGSRSKCLEIQSNVHFQIQIQSNVKFQIQIQSNDQFQIQIQSNDQFQIQIQSDKVSFWAFAGTEDKSAIVLKPKPAA